MRVRQLLRRASVRASLVLAVVVVGVLTASTTPGVAASSRARDVSPATAARKTSVNLTGHLRAVGRPAGHILTEQGQFSGTFSGSATIRFTALTSNAGVGTFAFYPAGGSMSGHATTRSHVVGITVYFTGTMAITNGTGKWAHTSGENLHFSGTLNRHNLHVTTYVSGSINQ